MQNVSKYQRVILDANVSQLINRGYEHFWQFPACFDIKMSGHKYS